MKWPWLKVMHAMLLKNHLFLLDLSMFTTWYETWYNDNLLREATRDVPTHISVIFDKSYLSKFILKYLLNNDFVFQKVR